MKRNAVPHGWAQKNVLQQHGILVECQIVNMTINTSLIKQLSK